MGERYKQPCQHHQPCVESTAGPQGTLSSQRSLSKMIMAKANHLKSATNGVQTVPVPIPPLNPCDPLPHRSQSPHRSNILDKSFHQSPKNLRQSHLEEQCSALTYELELAKAANQKMARKAESAICKADRMDRDHSALVAERDAAIARAEAAEEEFKQFKSGDEYTGFHKMKKELHDKSDECLDLRSQLAAAVEQRDTAYSQLQQQAGEHLVREHSSGKVKVKTPSFSMGSSSMGIEVKVKAPSFEVEVKAPGIEVEV